MFCELESRIGEDKGQKFKIVMSVLKMKNEFCLEVAVRLELNLSIEANAKLLYKAN